MNTPVFRIGNRLIGEGHPPYFIAELGINHKGDINKARKMMDLAAQVGFDACKMQMYTDELFILRDYAPDQEAVLRRCALDYPDIVSLARYGRTDFIITPFDMPSLLELISWWQGWPGGQAIKIASGYLRWHEFIDRALGSGLPVIISTGMLNEQDLTGLRRVVDHENVALLHCVSLYPCPPERQNLARLQSLAALGRVVGYSVHLAPGLMPEVSRGEGRAVCCSIWEVHVRLEEDGDVEDMAVSQVLNDTLAAWIRRTREAGGMIVPGPLVSDAYELARTRHLRIHPEHLESSPISG